MNGLCLTIALAELVALLWLFYRNSVLIDENEFLSDRYAELSAENKVLREADIMRSCQLKTSAYETDIGMEVSDDENF